MDKIPLMKAPENKPPLPYVMSLLACEQIDHHTDTGQYSVRRIVTAFEADRFPMKAENLCLYAEVRDIQGKQEIRVAIVDDDNREIWLARAEIDAQDMRETLQMTIDASAATFPAAGEYRIQVFSDRTLLLERPIVVVPVGAAVV